jgi:uncharacterized protein YjbJ (UPF0337 family)
MINQQILEGKWNEIKGKLRSRWGQLTDDDLTQFHGQVDQLIGTIQRKTGEGRDAIERYIDDLAASPNVNQAAEAVQNTVKQATENVQRTIKQAGEQVQARYGEVEDFVRQRPGESLAVCFGAGVVTGVLLGLILTSK